MGAEVCPGTRLTHSTTLEADKRLVAGGRDLHQNQGCVEISVSRRGFGGQYAGLHAGCQARWQGSRKILSQSAQGSAHASATGDNSGQECGLLRGNREAQSRGAETQLKQSRYLNNRVEQDHRNIKRIVKPMMGFKSFNSARRTLSGIEAMHMIRKEQVKEVEQGDSVSQANFIESIFGIAA